MHPRRAAPRVVRFDLPQPTELMTVGAPKVSPDGRHIAFDGRDKSGKVQIWLRSLDEGVARPLAGTENIKTAGRPFWSPDSRYVAFFTSVELRRVNLAGGAVQRLCALPGGFTAGVDRRRHDPLLGRGHYRAALHGGRRRG